MVLSSIAVVVIGRNEGERLRACLESVLPHASHTVYVDSGSTDSSVELATRMGAHIVELDPNIPFTAARARNAGWKKLRELKSDASFIQFVDADCSLDKDWIPQALAEISSHPQAAVVGGHVRETLPERNIYHRLAAMEWDTPVGPSEYCGGIAMIRAAALEQVNGYKDHLIAGEEPELCVRLRQAGWTVLKLDYEMASHDSDLDTFRQWWRRMVRSGHAYAEGVAIHGAWPERHWVRQSRSIWAWGFALPMTAIAFAWPTRGISILVAIALYLVLGAKIILARIRRGESIGSSALYAAMCVIGKWPQAVGQVTYWINRLRHAPDEQGHFDDQAICARVQGKMES